MGRISRRTFLAGASVAAFGASNWVAGVQFGYAAITWGKEEKQAVDDISSAGYAGIQFRIEAITEFTPAQLKDLLADHKLTFTALSSGQISLDAPEAETLSTHTANAQFVKDSGGLYLQILDQLKPYPRQVIPAECTRLGKLLTELGKRTADLGVPLVYHNHMNTISEHPENLDRVMASSDPKYVKLLLDTAHSVAGGGNPVAEIEKYHDRIRYLHLKDVVDIPKDTPKTQYPFQFVELGRGRVDLPGVLRALEKVKYKGWAVVELDRVPVAGRTAKESALISRKYLEANWGAKFPAVS
jgi:inosose dehydratase